LELSSAAEEVVGQGDSAVSGAVGSALSVEAAVVVLEAEVPPADGKIDCAAALKVF
jgi:hypothetical protein